VIDDEITRKLERDMKQLVDEPHGYLPNRPKGPSNIIWSLKDPEPITYNDDNHKRTLMQLSIAAVVLTILLLIWS
jgi:hypothetical protein